MEWKLIEKKAGLLPDFDSNGNLPPGDYLPTREEFERKFVHIEGSKTRPMIFKGFVAFCEDLKKRGIPKESIILTDGSFTTNKIDPKDIDLVMEVWIEDSLFESLYRGDFFKGGFNKDKYFCDDYSIYISPSIAVSRIEYQRAYWEKCFGTDRQGNEKGRVWLTIL